MTPETTLSQKHSPHSVPPRLATPPGPCPAGLTAPPERSWPMPTAARGPPWQRAAGDLLGEMTPAGTYVYQVGVIMVPRQAGKTTFVFDLAQGRCIQHPDYRAAYTAQTGHVTTERFQELHGPELFRCPLAQVVSARRSAGTERMTVPAGEFRQGIPTA